MLALSPPTNPDPDSLDRLIKRSLGVAAFAVLMRVVWESAVQPDYMLQLHVLAGMILLILMLLGLGEILVRVLKAYRGTDTTTNTDTDTTQQHTRTATPDNTDTDTNTDT